MRRHTSVGTQQCADTIAIDACRRSKPIQSTTHKQVRRGERCSQLDRQTYLGAHRCGGNGPRAINQPHDPKNEEPDMESADLRIRRAEVAERLRRLLRLAVASDAYMDALMTKIRRNSMSSQALPHSHNAGVLLAVTVLPVGSTESCSCSSLWRGVATGCTAQWSLCRKRCGMGCTVQCAIRNLVSVPYLQNTRVSA